MKRLRNKEDSMPAPLDNLWEAGVRNRSIGWYKDLLKEQRDNLEFPIHIRDITNLGLIGAPITEDNYFVGTPEEYPKINLIPSVCLL